MDGGQHGLVELAAAQLVGLDIAYPPVPVRQGRGRGNGAEGGQSSDESGEDVHCVWTGGGEW